MNTSFLRITTVERPPYAIFIRGEDGNVTDYQGYIFDIVNLFMEKFNISYDVMIPSDNQFGYDLGNGSWTGMIGLLLTKQVDMAAAFITFTEERMNAIDFSIAFSHEAFNVLQRHPVKEGNPAALMAPFSFQTWVLLLIMSGVMAVVIHGFCFAENVILTPHKKFSHWNSFGESVYYVFETMVNQAVKVHLVTISNRMLHVTWWLFIVTVTALYTASLTAYMTIPLYDVKVKQMEDIPKYTDVKWMVKRGSSLQSDILTSKDTPLAERNSILISLQDGLDRQMGIFVNDEDEAIELILKKSYVYIREKTIIKAIIEEDLRNKTYCRFMIGEDGQIKTMEGFGFPKGSSYRPLFNAFITTLDRNGILVGLRNRYQSSKLLCPLTIRGDSDARPLSLGDFVVIFIILATGLALSIVVLVLERSKMCCTRKESHNYVSRKQV